MNFMKVWSGGGKDGFCFFFFATWASACGRPDGRRQEAEVRAEDHHFLERILPPLPVSFICFVSVRVVREDEGENVFSLFSHSVFFASLFRGTWFLLWFNYHTDGRKNYNVAGCTTENRLLFFYFFFFIKGAALQQTSGELKTMLPCFSVSSRRGKMKKTKKKTTLFPPVEISFEVFPSLGSSGVSASACVSPKSS